MSTDCFALTKVWKALTVAASLRQLPRLGGRATGFLLGASCLLVLIDGIAHPRQVDGLWLVTAAHDVADAISA
ncbi:MAG: hypothetical protein ACJ789_00480 [Thermomicrobiales bacterium]